MSDLVIERPSRDSLTQTEKGVITVSREFEIIASSKVTALALLENQKGVFQGVVYKDALGAVPFLLLQVREISIQPPDGGREFIGVANNSYYAIAKYSTDDGSGGMQSTSKLEIEPDGPAHFSNEVSLSQVPSDIDINGNVMANAAGVPYAGISFLKPTIFIVAEWIDSNTNWFTAFNFVDTFIGFKNSAEWKGIVEDRLLMHSIQVQALETEAFASAGLVKFIARIERRDVIVVPGFGIGGGGIASGFDAVVLNKGRLQRSIDIPEELEPITATDASTGRKTPVSQDVLLDSDGRAQPADEQSPIGFRFEGQESTDFNRLRI